MTDWKGEVPESLPLSIRGPPKMCEIWKNIKTIPKGVVYTFAQVAEEVHSTPQRVGIVCSPFVSTVL